MDSALESFELLACNSPDPRMIALIEEAYYTVKQVLYKPCIEISEEILHFLLTGQIAPVVVDSSKVAETQPALC